MLADPPPEVGLARTRHRRRHQGIVRQSAEERPNLCRVQGRFDAPEPEASGPWLYLVVMLEFQSTVDYLMPLRIRNYVDSFYMEQWRGRRFGCLEPNRVGRDKSGLVRLW